MSPKSSQEPLHTERITRQTVNGRSTANYDQKLHPVDEIIRPANWARRHGLASPRGVKRGKFDDSETEDEDITLPSGSEEDDPHSPINRRPQRRSRSPDPKATRRSQRSAARVRHEYRKTVHPNDDSIFGYGRRSRKRKNSRPPGSSNVASSIEASTTPASSAVDSCISSTQLPTKKRKRREVVAIQFSSDRAEEVSETESESEVDQRADGFDQEVDPPSPDAHRAVERVPFIADSEEPEATAGDPPEADPGIHEDTLLLGPVLEFVNEPLAPEDYNPSPPPTLQASPGGPATTATTATHLAESPEYRSPPAESYHPILAPTQAKITSSPFSGSFKDTTLSLAPPDENTAPSSSPTRSSPFPSSPMAEVLRNQIRGFQAVNAMSREFHFSADGDDDEEQHHEGFRPLYQEECASSGGWRGRYDVGSED